MIPSSDYRGKTFLVDDDDGDGKHLHVIISRCCPKGRVLVVNFTKGYNLPGGDSRCIVKPGEHPFIDCLSAIVYSKAKIKHLSFFTKGVELGSIIAKEPVNHRLLRRIQEGARDNDDIESGCEDYFQYF